jgi:hypothetical protein
VADPKNFIVTPVMPWWVNAADDIRQVSAADPLPVTAVAGTITSISQINTVSLVTTVSLVSALTTVSLVTAVTSITNPVTVTGSVTNSFAVNQISVTGSATPLFAINVNPTFREVVNLSSSIVYIGGTGVTTTSGYAVLGGAAFSMERNTGALSAIVTAGTAGVAIIGW